MDRYGGSGTAAALAAMGFTEPMPPPILPASPPVFAGPRVPPEFASFPTVGFRQESGGFSPFGFRSEAPGFSATGFRPEGGGIATTGFRPEGSGPFPTIGLTETVPGQSGITDPVYQQKLDQAIAQFGGVGTGAGINAGIGGGTTMGGDWAGVERWSKEINAAAARFGVPVNLLKAIMRLESGGDPGSGSPQGATGLMQIMPSWNGTAGLSIYDNAQNVMLGAKILADSANRWKAQGASDPWQEATRDYIGRGGPDAFGTDQNSYWRQISTYLGQLGGYGGTGPTTPGTGGGTGMAANILAEAQKYVGKVPYVWGGIPGKGQSPYDDGGGWDCSGFTYWLDQNYGTGTLPMGSHYQYQWGLDNGKINRDPNQLQPGDIVFWDTGWQGGAGSELNHAGHTGIYLGNGKMIHASNATTGTTISDISWYFDNYTFLGGMRLWGGGASAAGGGYSSGNAYAPSGYGGDFTSFFLSHLYG